MIKISKREIEQAKDLISEEVKLHAVAGLADICKLFYQAINGPGHLIDDLVRAREFLHEELKVFYGNRELPVQDISFSGNDFCRVNLVVIKNGLISEEDFFQRFIKSVLPAYDNEGFLRKWEIYASLIRDMQILGENYEPQHKSLLEFLSSGRGVHSRHSEIYRQRYNPHYRLIRKRFIGDLIQESGRKNIIDP